MRYSVSAYGKLGKPPGVYASKYQNDVWLMENGSNKYEYAYDETNNSLLVVNTLSKETVLAITSDGKVVIRIPTSLDVMNRPYMDRVKAKFLLSFCSTVFGYKVLMINRFGKNRVYVYPDNETWIDWDSNPLVEKYLIDDDAPAVIMDLNMKVLYGATPQKNPSNKRVGNPGTPTVRCKKESDW